MADLSSLIRLHKHELDEKRQALGALYAEAAELERQRRDLEREFKKEKEAVDATGDIHFTFASYVEEVKKKRKAFDKADADVNRRIEKAKESMMETFSELKKYETAQEKREEKEAEARRVKESHVLDEIGIEGFRRKKSEGGE